MGFIKTRRFEHFLYLVRGYKKKVASKSSLDKDNLLICLHIDIANFLNNSNVLTSVQLNYNVDNLYDFYLNLLKLQQFSSTLPKAISQLESSNVRYINSLVSGKLEEFDALIRVLAAYNRSMYQILINYSAALADSETYKLKNYKLKWRVIYATIESISDYVFSLSLILSHATAYHIQTSEDNGKIVPQLLQNKNKNFCYMESVIVEQLSNGQSYTDIYTLLDSYFLEIKDLVRDYILTADCFYDNDFNFLSKVYKQSPYLHAWLTYEFVQTGSISQTLANVYQELNRLMKQIRQVLFKRRAFLDFEY